MDAQLARQVAELTAQLGTPEEYFALAGLRVAEEDWARHALGVEMSGTLESQARRAVESGVPLDCLERALPHAKRAVQRQWALGSFATSGSEGLVLVFSALLGAIVWNLTTWYFGLPSSSSHALIGGLVGAALAASQAVQWAGVMDKVVIPMVLSPLIGFGLAYLAMVGLLHGPQTERSAGNRIRGIGGRDVQPHAPFALGSREVDVAADVHVLLSEREAVLERPTGERLG